MLAFSRKVISHLNPVYLAFCSKTKIICNCCINKVPYIITSLLPAKEKTNLQEFAKQNKQQFIRITKNKQSSTSKEKSADLPDGCCVAAKLFHKQIFLCEKLHIQGTSTTPLNHSLQVNTWGSE